MICEKCGCDARVGSVSEQPDGAHVTYICANPQCSLCGQKIGEEILQPEKTTTAP